jgi:hypothetical protein
MYTLFLVWTVSAAITFGSFALFSLYFDGRVTMSTWIRLALGLMLLIGPLGTALTLRFLYQGTVEVSGALREARRTSSAEPEPADTRLISKKLLTPLP